MSKCCGRARSASQKCKIKGKWKSDRRWKRAIRPATVEWVSAVLSDTVRRHYKLRWLWCPSTGSRAVIATIRHFVTHHYEFGSVRPLQKPTWALSVFILLAVTLTWVWLHIPLNCKSVRLRINVPGWLWSTSYLSKMVLPRRSKLEIVLAAQIAWKAGSWAR